MRGRAKEPLRRRHYRRGHLVKLTSRLQRRSALDERRRRQVWIKNQLRYELEGCWRDYFRAQEREAENAGSILHGIYGPPKFHWSETVLTLKSC